MQETQDAILKQIQELQDKLRDNEATVARERDQLASMCTQLEEAKAREKVIVNPLFVHMLTLVRIAQCLR